jgi:nicotinate-nucleotide adenylyltransferase
MGRFVPKPVTIGILGGTFDPIHYGHLRIAETLREVYALDSVRLIPTGLPPHRVSPNVTGDDRFQMVQLAIEHVPYFIADSREIVREGWCYTFDTLAEIRTENPKAQLVWLVGTDAFAQLMQWHRWQELLECAHLAIAHRPGASLQAWYAELPQALKQQYDQRQVLQSTMPYQVLTGKISLLPTILLDISATLLRDKVAQHESVRFLTPDSVIDYIEQHGLYQ